ncbi:BlaI/MecI/CopY family transcriptional regulator [Candidatus Sumerlaeota bacterium]|nr:BlaI/MecI/CopY family transcriptional regulator [Candidatus Sumerlaeota bacterium]
MMPRNKSHTLTELELAIMQIVWNSGEVLVEDIRQTLEEQGRPLALPSIRTMLSILQDKGYVTRRKVGRGHAYQAIVPQDKARKNIIKDLVNRAFEGSAMNLVAALLDTRMVSENELSKVKSLIRKYEKEAEKR